MCGICGIIPASGRAIRKMNPLMLHRGPDGEGYYEDETISLGHTRLAIIDLKTGNQPIYNETREICIIFNGEIYNYKDLRRQLEGKHRFYTNSDTEVIVHLYEEMGVECLKKMNGMFAFAIWDKRKESLFLARDRLGIKPLYYTEEGPFAFASELAPLISLLEQKTIDPFALSVYLTLGYIFSPHTIIREIKKLPPGYFGIWKDGRFSVKRYWSVKVGGRKAGMKEHNAVFKIRSLMDESVRLRLKADVPVGILLSGGIDSAVITAVASKYKSNIHTFTVGFSDEEYDERGYARLIARKFNTNHKEILVDTDIWEELQNVINFVDEPIADEALIPTYLISKLASEDVKVILSGEGGDENFGGYPRYLLSTLSDRLVDVTPLKTIMEMLYPFLGSGAKTHLKKMLSAEKDTLKKNIKWLSIFTEEEKKRLLGKPLEEIDLSGDGLKSLFYFDLTKWLPDDILQKLDRATMANSIEGRVPFLDHNVVSYCAGMGETLKIRGFNTKYLLKTAYRDMIPEEIIKRRKHGFLSPFNEWFDDKFLDECRSILSHSKFNHIYTEEIISQAKANRDCAKKLWTLLMFEMWRERQKIDFNF